jgi:hypothetical protein
LSFFTLLQLMMQHLKSFCMKKMQKWCRSGGHGIYQLSYQRIWKMSRKQIKHNFHPKITLIMCHIIKQLMPFHFGGHWFIIVSTLWKVINCIIYVYSTTIMHPGNCTYILQLKISLLLDFFRAKFMVIAVGTTIFQRSQRILHFQ